LNDVAVGRCAGAKLVAGLVAVPVALAAVPVAAPIYGLYRLLSRGRTGRPVPAHVELLLSQDELSTLEAAMKEVFTLFFLRLPHTPTKTSDVDNYALRRLARAAMLPYFPRFVNIQALRLDITITYSPGSPTVCNINLGIAFVHN